MTDQKLQVIPLGGLGEFGMNMTAIRFGEDLILIDCGDDVPRGRAAGRRPGNARPHLPQREPGAVRALILTHGHEDHIGAVPYLLSEIDVPVYGTDFTLALVDRRLEEYELEEEPRFIRSSPNRSWISAPSKSSSFTSRTPS